jgi:glutathione S-transferase
MPTLYGVFRSRASRPIWLMYELDQPFTHVPVIQAYRLPDPQAPGAPLNTASAAFLKVNPIGLVPAYVDGDLILTESLAINLYIAGRHGGPIGPENPDEAALMANWAFFTATSVEGAAVEITYVYRDGLDKTPEGQVTLSTHAEKLRRPLKRLEAHLATHPYLVADHFTVADLNLAECVRYAQPHPTLLSEFPAVEAWLERCQAREAFKRMWAARMAEPA